MIVEGSSAGSLREQRHGSDCLQPSASGNRTCQAISGPLALLALTAFVRLSVAVEPLAQQPPIGSTDILLL